MAKQERRISKDEFGSGGPPALTAEVLEMDPGDVMILTVGEVDPDVEIPVPGADKPRRALVIRFEEFPDHAYYANKTSVGRLIDALGEVPMKWEKARVPLYCLEQQNPQTSEMGAVVWVADPKLWDKHLKGSKRAEKVRAKPRGRK